MCTLGVGGGALARLRGLRRSAGLRLEVLPFRACPGADSLTYLQVAFTSVKVRWRSRFVVSSHLVQAP